MAKIYKEKVVKREKIFDPVTNEPEIIETIVDVKLCPGFTARCNVCGKSETEHEEEVII